MTSVTAPSPSCVATEACEASRTNHTSELNNEGIARAQIIPNHLSQVNTIVAVCTAHVDCQVIIVLSPAAKKSFTRWGKASFIRC